MTAEHRWQFNDTAMPGVGGAFVRAAGSSWTCNAHSDATWYGYMSLTTSSPPEGSKALQISPNGGAGRSLTINGPTPKSGTYWVDSYLRTSPPSMTGNWALWGVGGSDGGSGRRYSYAALNSDGVFAIHYITDADSWTQHRIVSTPAGIIPWNTTIRVAQKLVGNGTYADCVEARIWVSGDLTRDTPDYTLVNSTWLNYVNVYENYLYLDGPTDDFWGGTGIIDDIRVSDVGWVSRTTGGSPQTLNPASIGSASTVGTPKIIQTVKPASIGPTSTVGTPNANMVVAPASIAPASTVGTPQLNVTAVPASIAPTSAVGTPTASLSGAPQTVNPASIASTSTVGTPNANVVVAPASVSSASTVGTPTIVLGGAPQILNPASITSTSSVGTPVATLRLQILSPASIAGASIVGTPTATVSGAPQTLNPTSVTSTATVGTPVAFTSQTVAPASITASSAVGSPTLVKIITLTPASVGPTSVVGTPLLLVAQLVVPASIASASVVSTPRILGGVQDVVPMLVAARGRLEKPARAFIEGELR